MMICTITHNSAMGKLQALGRDYEAVVSLPMMMMKRTRLGKLNVMERMSQCGVLAFSWRYENSIISDRMDRRNWALLGLNALQVVLYQLSHSVELAGDLALQYSYLMERLWKMFDFSNMPAILSLDSTAFRLLSHKQSVLLFPRPLLHPPSSPTLGLTAASSETCVHLPPLPSVFSLHFP